ncbi:DUF6233 domain-containing protein [Streptomyces canus]|uniref:DUF6233 domain-containing protein n=1 Tax=Streptomyces canus TaxID=58343 RepID=UPI0033DBB1D4
MPALSPQIAPYSRSGHPVPSSATLRLCVNDSSLSRLDLLRFLERAQEREVERQRGIRTRPPTPEWLIELGLNRHAAPVYVHVGECWNAGKRSRGISRDQARRAPADGVKACPQCQPDRALGMLD